MLEGGQAIWSQPEVRAILEVLQPWQVLLVGGAVRDLLLGRDLKDLDFLIDCEAEPLLERRAALAEATGMTVIVLDSERGVLRVCSRDSEGLDLAARQGESLERDLARRDLTFNAMALASDGSLLDPFDGCRDLQLRRVRVTAPAVLREDPLRVLRCLRLAAQLGFSLEESTRQELARHAAGLRAVAGERIWEELQRFLSLADWSLMEVFREAELPSAIWAESVPGWEASALRWRWLEQWWKSRSASAVSQGADAVLSGAAPGQQAEEAVGAEATGAVGGLVPEERVLASLAALLLPFADHLEALAWRVRMSRAQSRYLKAWWDGHQLLRAGFPHRPREVLGLVRVAGESLPGLLSFAMLPDFATPPLPRPLAERLSRASRGEGELRLSPLPLNGEELCAHLQRRPGPWLGELLAELAAAWACREVADREGLLAHAVSSSVGESRGGGESRGQGESRGR